MHAVITIAATAGPVVLVGWLLEASKEFGGKIWRAMTTERGAYCEHCGRGHKSK